MIFAFFLKDREDTAALRQQWLVAHREYLGRVAERIAFAGPLTSEDGNTFIGSLLVIEFDSRAAAQAWLEEEPFYRAGIFGSCSVEPFFNRWPQRVGFPPESL